MATTCLVTGGGGFIGSHLVDRLLADGHQVRVLDNFSTGKRANLAHLDGRVEVLEGDLLDPRALLEAARGVEIVFHQAALPSVPRSIQDPLSTNAVNVEGTLRLLLAARDAGARRVVSASSSSVYGDTPVLPKREDMVGHPLSPYAVSKLVGEHYSRVFASVYGLETVSLRYFNVFGPRQDPESPYAAVVPRFVAALQQGRSPVVYGDGEQSRDFTFVEDAVAANLAAAFRPLREPGPAYNVAGGRSTSVNQLLAWVAELLGREARPDYAPPRPGEVRDSLANIQRAQEDLGYAPRFTVYEALRRTVAWFAEPPPR